MDNNTIIAIGFTVVNAAFTMMGLKIYTELVKEKLQDKRKKPQSE